jgi:hypothetical protein
MPARNGAKTHAFLGRLDDLCAAKCQSWMAAGPSRLWAEQPVKVCQCIAVTAFACGSDDLRHGAGHDLINL